MRHLSARRILVSLALGVITTFAVAWASAICTRRTLSTAPLPQREAMNKTLRLAQPLPYHYPIHGWRARYGFAIFDAEPWHLYAFDLGEPIDESRRWYPAGGLHIRRIGWPMYALQSKVTREPASWVGHPRRWQLPLREIVNRGLNSDDLPWWLYAHGQRRLALIPLPGFAANTLFYAALWVPLLMASEVLR